MPIVKLAIYEQHTDSDILSPQIMTSDFGEGKQVVHHATYRLERKQLAVLNEILNSLQKEYLKENPIGERKVVSDL